LDLQASGDFPVDPCGYGFDNIGDVLFLSPVLTEKYLKAAEHIADIAIPSAESMQPVMSRYRAHIEATQEFPVNGEYTLHGRGCDRKPRASASGFLAAPNLAVGN